MMVVITISYNHPICKYARPRFTPGQMEKLENILSSDNNIRLGDFNIFQFSHNVNFTKTAIASSNNPQKTGSLVISTMEQSTAYVKYDHHNSNNMHIITRSSTTTPIYFHQQKIRFPFLFIPITGEIECMCVVIHAKKRLYYHIGTLAISLFLKSLFKSSLAAHT